MNDLPYSFVTCRFCKDSILEVLLWAHSRKEHPLEARKVKAYLWAVVEKENLLREIL